MSTFGCEGGCELRLDENGNEQGPGSRRGDGTRHTPQRCALVRAVRAAVEDAFPQWTVQIDPGPRSMPFIIVRLHYQAGSRVYGANYAVLDRPSTVIDVTEQAEWAVLGLNAQILRELPDDQTFRA